VGLANEQSIFSPLSMVKVLVTKQLELSLWKYLSRAPLLNWVPLISPSGPWESGDGWKVTDDPSSEVKVIKLSFLLQWRCNK